MSPWPIRYTRISARISKPRKPELAGPRSGTGYPPVRVAVRRCGPSLSRKDLLTGHRLSCLGGRECRGIIDLVGTAFRDSLEPQLTPTGSIAACRRVSLVNVRPYPR